MSSDVTRSGIQGATSGREAMTVGPHDIAASAPPDPAVGRGADTDDVYASYYEQPIVRRPGWSELDIVGYLFLGGLAGGSSMLSIGLDAVGAHTASRRAQFTAAAAIASSLGLLVHDLGRPARFLHMLRVFKPTSPMNMGSWLLSAYAPSAIAAAVAPFGPAWIRAAARPAPWVAAALAPAVTVVHGGAPRRHGGADVARRRRRVAVRVRRFERHGGRRCLDVDGAGRRTRPRPPVRPHRRRRRNGRDGGALPSLRRAPTCVRAWRRSPSPSRRTSAGGHRRRARTRRPSPAVGPALRRRVPGGIVRRDEAGHLPRWCRVGRRPAVHQSNPSDAVPMPTEPRSAGRASATPSRRTAVASGPDPVMGGPSCPPRRSSRVAVLRRTVRRI